VQSVKAIIANTFKLAKGNTIWEGLKEVFFDKWQNKRQRLLDYQITALFEVIETEQSADDYVWINRIANAVTGFEIEYWNDEKEIELADYLTKILRQIEEAPAGEERTENEIRLVLEGVGSQKVAQFDNRELSSMSQVMFKKMKTTIDSFGQALSPEEKMQVLAKLLSEIM